MRADRGAGGADSPPRRLPVGWIAAVLAAYVAGLVWADRDQQVLSRLAALSDTLLLALLPVSASYLLRYQRWRWLLPAPRRWGWWAGLPAYLAGFAFTATPGKVGELFRLRTFAALGVAPRDTFATFVFERALDLLVVLALATAVAGAFTGFPAIVVVVLALSGGLFALARMPRLLLVGGRAVALLPGRWPRRAADVALAGLDAMARHVRVRTLAWAALFGGGSWLLTALAFALLCHAAGLALPWPALLGIYPLAMLVGALSFVPGGVGTTEAAIVLLLRQFDVGLGDAIAIAVGVRLATLWYAIAVGAIALLACELRGIAPPERA